MKTSGSLARPIVSRSSLERPTFWIVAGPNGSGKSSLYSDTNIEGFGASVWIINPDLLTARILDVEKLPQAESNLAAVKRIQAWLEASIEAHQTVGVETVLSTPKYRELVLAAKRRDFEIRLVYVLLRSVEQNIERVAVRVANGGHNVPAKKIRDRHHRSLAQLPWFLAQADRAWVFDNSGAKPQLIGDKQAGTITVDPLALPEIINAAQAAADINP